MNAIMGIYFVIIMIMVVLCGVTAWLIFRKLKYDNSVFMDMNDQELRKQRSN